MHIEGEQEKVAEVVEDLHEEVPPEPKVWCEVGDKDSVAVKEEWRSACVQLMLDMIEQE